MIEANVVPCSETLDYKDNKVDGTRAQASNVVSSEIVLMQ